MLPPTIIDEQSLHDDASKARRTALLSNIVSLFSMTSERCTAEQIDLYDAILLKLADMVETEVRAATAAKLAPLRRGPQQTLRHLAHDEIAVARPILVQSPLLTDYDLLEIMDSSSSHLDAITERTFISDRVTDKIISIGDDEIKGKIMANLGAAFSELGFAQLCESALSSPILALHLARRGDAPVQILERLAQDASAEVKRRLRDPEYALHIHEATIDTVPPRHSTEFWLEQYDFETPYSRLKRVGGKRIASESMLISYAEDDRFAEMIACFALMIELPVSTIAPLFVEPQTDVPLCLCRSLMLSPTTIELLMNVGPWKHRLTTPMRRSAAAIYNKLDTHTARETTLQFTFRAQRAQHRARA